MNLIDQKEDRRRKTDYRDSAASSRGSREAGSGLSARMARSFAAHLRYEVAEVKKPSMSRRIPRGYRPINGGRSWITARPPALRASAVRIQARKVRSLANENR